MVFDIAPEKIEEKGKVLDIPPKEETLLEPDYDNQVFTSGSGSGGAGATIYTVPEHFDLYLTNVFLDSLSNGTGAASSGPTTLEIEGHSLLIFQMRYDTKMKAYQSISIIPPLKIETGKEIKCVEPNAAISSNATIVGFLIGKKG